MTDFTAADAIGMFGAALIVIVYLLLQVERIDSRSVSFSAINALGAAGIIFSLYYKFNLSAFVIEAFWLAISLYGLYRALRYRHQRSAQG